MSPGCERPAPGGLWWSMMNCSCLFRFAMGATAGGMGMGIAAPGDREKYYSVLV